MNYFNRLLTTSEMRLWINNPTMAELDLSIEHQAIGITTNPTYAANQIKRDPAAALPIVRECLSLSDDDAVVADAVQAKLIERLLPAYQPHYQRSAGGIGFVSIQGDPRRDEEIDNIVEEARRYRQMGDNIVAKIPATKAGFAAIEILLKENVPCIATEVFGLPQMRRAVEVYRNAYAASGYRPAYFITHITGIYDEYLAGWAEDNAVDIAPEILAQAGTLLAHRQYQVHSQESLPGVLLGGGARQLSHFAEMTGGSMQVTINWSTADELLAGDAPIDDRIHAVPDQAVVDELLAKVPDFAASWNEDGLTEEQFESYGPVLFFRDMFLTGWNSLLATIAEERAK